MESLRPSVSVAFLILLLCTVTPPTASHDPGPGAPSPPSRVRRDVPVRSREEVAASSQALRSSLTLIGSVIGDSDSQKVSAMMKSLQNIASLAPVIPGLVSAFLNVASAVDPQETPLQELREGFAELNRRLDSLSVQTSGQATDAEWLGYAVVFARDEAAILNAWAKLDELRESSEGGRSREEKLQLAEDFAAYYQNSGAEDGLMNLHRYLTAGSTFLGGNLNQALRSRFRCDINEVLRYNLHASGLLWRGLLLKQLYGGLTGVRSAVRDAEPAQMFQKVSELQRAAVDFCLDNYQQYLKEDVVEITKKLSPGKEAFIADEVRKHLDQKFSWSSWVVFVLRTHWEESHSFPSMITVPVDEFHPGIGKLTVAVGYTQKDDDAAERDEAAVRKELGSCYEKSTKPPPRRSSSIVDTTECEDIATAIPRCGRMVGGVPLRELVKVMTFGSAGQRRSSEVGEAPAALQLLDCLRETLPAKISVHLSRNRTVCPAGRCLNGAACRRILDSNQHLCECPRGYHGDRCEHEMPTIAVQDAGRTVPGVASMDAKLELMEAKLQEILRIVNAKPPSQ